MNLKLLSRKKITVNLFILATLFLLGFAVLYFLYFRARNQAEVYITVSVGKSQTAAANTPFNWVPYWVGDAIRVGDKEVSPLGGVNAVVLEKNVYEAQYYGQNVNLLLQMKAIRDRSGVYLFKNKPLSVGAVIDLNLTKGQIQGLVTYVGGEKPVYQIKKLRVVLYGKNIEKRIADPVKVGSEIKDSDNRVIAKILDKRIENPTASVINYENNREDLWLTVELITKKIDSNYYYTDTQKVKADEDLFLPFKEVSLNLPIASVTEIQ